MGNRFIMTAFGKDRVGIVADVTRLLYENDCNLEDTSMKLLADQFTLNLLFSSKGGRTDEQLSRECRRLEIEKGISAYIRPLPSAEESASKNFQTCMLHVEGVDQAGIVFKISQFLADHGLNIIRLNSTPRSSPESGVTIYSMDITIQAPEGFSPEQLDDDLSSVADELNVDVNVSPE